MIYRSLISILLITIFLCGTVSALDVFVTDPITDSRIYFNTDLSGHKSNTIKMVSAKNEFICSTFTLKSTTDMTGVTLEVSSIDKDLLNTIPTDNIKVRIVKVWYQRGDGIHDPVSTRLYVPELLLNDETLIDVTYISMTQGGNKIKDTSGTYHDISQAGQGSETIPVEDATTLQPFDLDAGENKQFWITIYVPDISHGNYNGEIKVKHNNEVKKTIKIEFEVLPYTLPDPSVEQAIYFGGYIDSYELGHRGRTETQLNYMFKDMAEHGIKYPTIGHPYFRSDFSVYTDLWEDYFPMDKIYYTQNLVSGNKWGPLNDVATNVNNLKTYFETNYGTQEFYFYTIDETDTVPQAPYIEQVRSVGAKTFCAQSSVTILTALNHDPPLLDLAILYSNPIRTMTNLYHNEGLKIGCYANPQVGEEKPETYRRNFGLLLWQHDVDVAMDFAYQYGYGILWNDWSWPAYKQHVMTYPTLNDVVGTIQWEGYREGVNDVRYINYLESIAEGHYSSEEYLGYLKNANLESLNLNEVRNEIINHIKLIEHPTPGFEVILVIIGIVILNFWVRRR